MKRTKFKLTDKRAALVDLARFLGFQRDVVSHEVTVKDQRKAIDDLARDLTDQELEKVVAHFDAIRLLLEPAETVEQGP